MKLPALLIAIFVAAGVLAASPIPAHSRHGLDLSLATALLCIIGGFAFAKFRHAKLAWAAGLIAWFCLAAAAGQAERLAIPVNQVTNLAGAGRLDLEEPLRWRGILRADPLRMPWGIRYDIDLQEVQAAGQWNTIHGGLRTTYFFGERATGATAPVRAGERLEILARARLVR